MTIQRFLIVLMKWLAAFALASGIVMLIRLFCIESYRISTDSMEEALQKGDYIKLKNLTIGYTLPAVLSKKVYAQNIRFFASGENLFTITGYEGMDPEMRTAVGYSTMRQYAFGVNITF